MELLQRLEVEALEEGERASKRAADQAVRGLPEVARLARQAWEDTGLALAAHSQPVCRVVRKHLAAQGGGA